MIVYKSFTISISNLITMDTIIDTKYFGSIDNKISYILLTFTVYIYYLREKFKCVIDT